ncbi:MAG: hypothetical protein QM831_07950 [Kofleriaceae bacterium]
MRRFERPNYSDFIEIRVRGADVIVHFGSDTGRSRRISERGTPEDALAAMERMIKSYLDSGYVETIYEEQTDPNLDTQVFDKRPFVPNPALEQQCREAPDDPHPWAVYADFLMLHGDPRGEIAAAFAAGESAYAVRRAKEVYDVLTNMRTPPIELGYRHGFAVTAKIPTPRVDEHWNTRDVTTRLLASPIATLLEQLTIGLTSYDRTNDWRPALEAIVGCEAGQRLKRLAFDNTDAYLALHRPGRYVIGDWTGLLDRLPALESLEISGDVVTYGKIDLPALRSFRRIAHEMSPTELTKLAATSWPLLESLAISFGADSGSVTPAAQTIVPLLTGKNLPRVRHLALTLMYGSAILRAVAASELLPRLSVLDLGGSALAGEEDVQFLEQHAAAFLHLDRLVLTGHIFDADDIARVQAALPNAELAGPHPIHDPD